ncbi:MAG: helix-turn-helix transcriptional regulator [Alphaproteobacteria bacterium]|nr:helix-turn-helix transcriptional regulator [Alphaproteobacteria bacterium]
MLELLAGICRTPEHRTCATKPVWLTKSCFRIREQLEFLPSVSELARQAGVHPVYYARSFRAHLGLSPGAYVRLERAKRTADLLAKSKLTLAQIALACGYGDQPTFSKGFKRVVGVPPGAFRQEWRK